MLQRAYSVVILKSVDAERRIITGRATSPTPDRMGDIVEPLGVSFKNPLPLLLYHDSKQPVGLVTFKRPTKDGVDFEAHIPTINEPPSLKDRVDTAWSSVKAGLLKGVSIGFRSIEHALIQETQGLRFLKTEVLELSLVAVPANVDATIHAIKSYDSAQRAQSGTAVDEFAKHHLLPAAVGVHRNKDPHMTASEQLTAAQADLTTKSTRLQQLVDLDGADGGLEDAQMQERNALTEDVSQLSARIASLKALEAAQLAQARPAVVKASQGDVRDASRVTVGDAPEQKLPPGIEFARYVICRMAALKTGLSPLEIAKHRYPENQRIQMLLKEAVPAGSTQDSTYAGPLVYAQNLVSEFTEYLRPQTIIGRIDGFTRVPFNVRITGQTTGGSGYWVGEGKAKPLTKFDYNAVTLTWAKVANIAVITDELARFSSPAAEALVRDGLAAAARERLDIDFIDPAKAAVANVSPASITNGLTNLDSSGVTLDAVDVDVQAMMSQFIQNHIMPTHWIMPNTVALALSLMRTSLGNYAFPTVNMNGGTFYGLPVITSQYAILGTPANNLIVLLSAPNIFVSDDGGFSIDISREASLEMDDAPTMDAGSLGSPAGATGTQVVSMFQTNSLAIRCERYINWARRRDAGVVWMDDVQWAAGTQ